MSAIYLHHSPPLLALSPFTRGRPTAVWISAAARCRERRNRHDEGVDRLARPRQRGRRRPVVGVRLAVLAERDVDAHDLRGGAFAPRRRAVRARERGVQGLVREAEGLVDVGAAVEEEGFVLWEVLGRMEVAGWGRGVGTYSEGRAARVRRRRPFDDFVAELLDRPDHDVEGAAHGRHGAHGAVVAEDAEGELAAAGRGVEELPHRVFLLAAPRDLVHERVVQPRLLREDALHDQSQPANARAHRPDDRLDRVLALHAVRHALVRHAARAGADAVQPVERRRDADAPADVRAEAHGAASEREEGALAARAAAAGEVAVLRVPAVPDDVVHRLPDHQRVRYGCLNVQYGAEGAQLAHHLGFVDALFAGVFEALKGVNPAYVAHGGFNSADVELIFEGDREAMEWANGGVVLGIVVVELLRVGDCCVKENLVETADLL